MCTTERIDALCTNRETAWPPTRSPRWAPKPPKIQTTAKIRVCAVQNVKQSLNATHENAQRDHQPPSQASDETPESIANKRPRACKQCFCHWSGRAASRSKYKFSSLGVGVVWPLMKFFPRRFHASFHARNSRAAWLTKFRTIFFHARLGVVIALVSKPGW